jgi:SAM-dependent methyltransferase
MAEEDPRALVRSGWDRVSRIYRPEGAADDVFGHGFEGYRAWLEPLFQALPEGASVLDLGCGCGVPTSALLASRFRVTGVDLSDVQVGRARALVPKARFERGDMAEVEFPPTSFDAVVCLYALIHVPRGRQRAILEKVRRWLIPGGWFVMITGRGEYEGIEPDWLGSGVPMFWSHADAATYRSWLEASGFDILSQSFIPEGDGGHELFTARATRPSPRD